MTRGARTDARLCGEPPPKVVLRVGEPWGTGNDRDVGREGACGRGWGVWEEEGRVELGAWQ